MTKRFLPLIALGAIAVAEWVPAAKPSAPPGEWIILVGGVSLNQWEKYKAQPHDHWWANFVHAARIRTEQLRAQFGPDLMITWLVYKPAYIERAKQDGVDLVGDINSVRDKFNLRLVYFNKGGNVIASSAKAWLHETDLSKIDRHIFAKGAFVKSWGCHTGEEMSNYWHAATGTRMWGAIGKTQFMDEELPILTSEGGKWVN